MTPTATADPRTSFAVTPSAELDSLVPPAAVNRRGFMAGSLAAGFAASVAPTGDLLAQTISTSAAGLRTGEVRIMTRDGLQMPAYFALPAGVQAAPTVLVVQEIFGVHEYIRDVCRRLAQAGYCAIAPELFFRMGDPSRYESAAQIVQTLVPKITDDAVMADLDSTADYIHVNGGDRTRLGITGFCWGGRKAWLYAAHSPRVKAAVAWYGRLAGAPSPATPRHPHDLAGALRAPVLGLYGSADTGIPVDTVEEMKRRLAAAGTPAARASSFVVYPDAPHAFHADYRPSYRKPAAEDGFKRALDWFRTHGVS
jgi:carboxymethylenebutenolidase